MKEIKEKEKNSKIIWDEKKNTWLNDIDEIFGTIKNWFSNLEKENLIEFIDIGEKTVSEDYIGEYTVKELGIKLNENTTIIFEPIGTLLVGAWGRIDFYVHGKISEKYMIVKVKDEEENFCWEIRQKNNPSKNEKFTKENMEKCIENWI